MNCVNVLDGPFPAEVFAKTVIVKFLLIKKLKIGFESDPRQYFISKQDIISFGDKARPKARHSSVFLATPRTLEQ